jgi:hypothetical protein
VSRAGGAESATGAEFVELVDATVRRSAEYPGEAYKTAKWA